MGPWASHTGSFESQLLSLQEEMPITSGCQRAKGILDGCSVAQYLADWGLPRVACLPLGGHNPLLLVPQDHFSAFLQTNASDMACVSCEFTLCLMSVNHCPPTLHPEAAEEPALCILCILVLSGYCRYLALYGFRATWMKPCVKLTFFYQKVLRESFAGNYFLSNNNKNNNN